MDDRDFSVPKLIKLFLNAMYISAFTFGGGFVIVTLMKKKFVDELHWITEEEMIDFTALAQSSPRCDRSECIHIGRVENREFPGNAGCGTGNNHSADCNSVCDILVLQCFYI